MTHYRLQRFIYVLGSENLFSKVYSLFLPTNRFSNPWPSGVATLHHEGASAESQKASKSSV